MQTSPPSGSAISGSIEILKSGLNASKMITTSGPAIAAKKDGRFFSSDCSRSLSKIMLSFFLFKREARRTVTTTAQIAGTIFRIIKEVRSI